MMPASNRKTRKNTRKSMYGAEAQLDAAQYINFNLKELGEVIDRFSGIFGGRNPTWFNDFDLTDVKQKTLTLFEELENLEQMVKHTKYYDPNVIA